MITVTKAGIVFTGKGDTGSSTVTYAPSKTADEEEQVNFLYFSITFYFEILL